MGRYDSHYTVEEVQLKAIHGNVQDITERVDVPDDAKEAAERIDRLVSEIRQNKENTPTRQDYRQAVEAKAESVIEAVREYDQELSEAVWESVDGSHYTMYTSKALKVLQYSANEPEEWKHYVSDNDGWEGAVRAMTFTVLRQDVYDKLERMGFLTDHWEINEEWEPEEEDG